MNPSSSSNADAPPGPVFHVRTRAVSADLTVAGDDESPRDLGNLDRARFESILVKLAALVLPPGSDADPYLTVTARRGRFLVRPRRGRCLVAPAGSLAHDSVELATGEVPDYLAEVEPSEGMAPVAANVLPPEPVARDRTGLVLLLAAVSALALAGSVFFTFRSDSVDPDSAYSPLRSEAQLDTLKAQTIGRFVTGSDDGGRALEIRADGTLTWIEYFQDQSVANERRERFTFAMRDGQPVLRAAGLGGPIAIQGPNTLLYAHEKYLRVP